MFQTTVSRYNYITASLGIVVIIPAISVYRLKKCWDLMTHMIGLMYSEHLWGLIDTTKIIFPYASFSVCA